MIVPDLDEDTETDPVEDSVIVEDCVTVSVPDVVPVCVGDTDAEPSFTSPVSVTTSTCPDAVNTTARTDSSEPALMLVPASENATE